MLPTSGFFHTRGSCEQAFTFSSDEMYINGRVLGVVKWVQISSMNQAAMYRGTNVANVACLQLLVSF